MVGADGTASFRIDLPDSSAALALAGEAEATLHLIADLTGASLVLRGLSVVIQGSHSQLERTSALVELLRPLWQEGQPITAVDLQTALTALDTGRGEEHRELGHQVLARSQNGVLLRPRTLRQQTYVEAMERHDLTLAMGPAGTGKTFLATVQAVRMLQERTVQRLILTRPAVEAGERLGFLPGDLQQKVDPYLRPRTLRQKGFIEAMERHDLTLAIGPAGTGKTFLATVQAVRMLQERRVERLVLTRPAVEAGERLGFLPGDLQQKVDPYLRPIYDALHTLLGRERTEALLEKGVIEVAPLAYMRGRTLAEAFVILDEAQNTTTAQMRMVLTRLGENSRMVVTGDVTQIDLPAGQRSGLIEAEQVLAGVEGVAICHFSDADVVRHPLVQRLVQAYARRDAGSLAPSPST